MESQRGFSKLISVLPKNFTVLDAGSGGLQGKNTTEYLAAYFDPKNILGFCLNEHDVAIYHAQRAEKKLPLIKILPVDFYRLEFDPLLRFDLAVLDMNIKNNLEKDWSDEGLERMRGLVKDGGYLINYIMLTDQYGIEGKTPEMIRSHWRIWWRTEKLTLKEIGRRLTGLKGWEVFAHDIDERRPYILWIMLKKTNGS